MEMKKENVPPMTEEEILTNTQGVVRTMIEKIINVPDVKAGDQITDAIRKYETRRKTLMEIFYYFTPVAASIREHLANPEAKLSEDAGTYLSDLNYEYPADQVSPFLERCTSFEFLTENRDRIGKRFMIAYILFPNGQALGKLLLSLRSDISQCIIMGDYFKRMLMSALSNAPVQDGKQVYKTIPEPQEEPARDPAKEAADAELLKQQMKTGRVDRKLIPVPKPTRLKPSSVRTLLAPVVARMTDYPVFAEQIRIWFDVWGGHHRVASQQFGEIFIFVSEIAFSKKLCKKNPADMLTLGRETVRALAHEFRHSQQELLWDTDIPVVNVDNMFENDYSFRRKDVFLHYKNDPGEVDAREFADKVVNSIEDGPYLRMVSRLAQRCLKRQFLAYNKLSLDFLAKEIAKCDEEAEAETSAPPEGPSPDEHKDAPSEYAS